MSSTHTESLDFVWEDSLRGKVPGVDYMRGIEGWLSCARAAFNALDPQDNTEEPYKTFVAGIKANVDKKLDAMGDERLLPLLSDILRDEKIDQTAEWMRGCLVLMQHLTSNQLWRLGCKWPNHQVVLL